MNFDINSITTGSALKKLSSYILNLAFKVMEICISMDSIRHIPHLYYEQTKY